MLPRAKAEAVNEPPASPPTTRTVNLGGIAYIMLTVFIQLLRYFPLLESKFRRPVGDICEIVSSLTSSNLYS